MNDLSTAISIVRLLDERFESHHFSIGGSVVLKARVANDIDIICYPTTPSVGNFEEELIIRCLTNEFGLDKNPSAMLGASCKSYKLTTIPVGSSFLHFTLHLIFYKYQVYHKL